MPLLRKAMALLALTTNPFIVHAASTVAKKAFEAVARKSVSNISVLITDSFQGDKEVLRLRDSLEMKLKVVSLPIDLCVRQAVRGNTALQGALDLALKVLQDIETFEQALQRQAIGAARGDRTTPERAASTARQLEGLLRQLDGLLPYLGVTISSVGLLDAGVDSSGPSLSRLMAASWRVRSCTNPGAAVITLGSAAWLKQGLTATKVPVRPMKTEFMLASVSLQRSCSSDEADSGAEAQALPGAWEVAVKQVLDDGTYHEDDEVAGSHTLQMQDIIGLDWATSQSLGLGDSDMQPALVIFAVKAGSTIEASGACTPAQHSSSAASPSSGPAGSSASRLVQRASSARDPASKAQEDLLKFAIQISTAAGEEEEQKPDLTHSEQWEQLSGFEYALQLCMLEAREEKAHHLVADERIRMAFNDVPAAGDMQAHTASSPSFVLREVPPRTPQMGSSGTRAASRQTPASQADVHTVTRDLHRLEVFGSPQS